MGTGTDVAGTRRGQGQVLWGWRGDGGRHCRDSWRGLQVTVLVQLFNCHTHYTTAIAKMKYFAEPHAPTG